jgi:transposase-like protein
MKTTLRKRYSSDFKAQIIHLFILGKTLPQFAEKFRFDARLSEN